MVRQNGAASTHPACGLMKLPPITGGLAYQECAELIAGLYGLAEILLRISDLVKCVMHALACAFKPLLAQLAKGFRPTPDAITPALVEGLG